METDVSFVPNAMSAVGIRFLVERIEATDWVNNVAHGADKTWKELILFPHLAYSEFLQRMSISLLDKALRCRVCFVEMTAC